MAAAAAVAARNPTRGRRAGKHKKKEPWSANIETITERNDDYRRVVHTSRHMQVVLMTLLPGETIPFEVHRGTDQFFRVEQGTGVLEYGPSGGGKKTHRKLLREGTAAVVPAGVRHEVRATSLLRLYTVYTPPNHAAGTVHRRQDDADAAEESSSRKH